MLAWLGDLCEQEELDKSLVEKLLHREQVLASVQDEVASKPVRLVGRLIPGYIWPLPVHDSERRGVNDTRTAKPCFLAPNPKPDTAD